MHPLSNSNLKAAIVIALAAALVPAGLVVARRDTSGDVLTGAQRTVIRQATEQFKDVDRAIEAGYVPTDECTELPDGSGAMGFHYVNPALASDANVDPTMPEVLLYVPNGRGGVKLAGVEYFVADADQDLTTEEDRPSLMGHPFDGPMTGHEAGMPAHYDLHVWVFQKNPDGELAAWNPAVHC